MSSEAPKMQAQGPATTGTGQPTAAKSPEEMAEALAQAKNWSSVALLSVGVEQVLQMTGQVDLPAETKIEDQTYIDNALGQLQLAKALDLLGHDEKAFHKATKAFKIIE